MSLNESEATCEPCPKRCYSWAFAGVASDAPSVCRDRSGRKLKTGLRSQPAERLRICKSTVYQRRVRAKRPNLTVWAPFRYRRLYPILLGQAKAESGVITRVTKNPDQWLVQGLGGAKYGMHKRSAHAESLLIGIHRQEVQAPAPLPKRHDHGCTGHDPLRRPRNSQLQVKAPGANRYLREVLR
jgi:hypothetical protein